MTTSTSYQTPTAFLEHCSLPAIHVQVPSSSSSSSSPPSPYDDDDDSDEYPGHSTSSRVWTPPIGTLTSKSSQGGFVLQRLVNGSKTLELRWSNLVPTMVEDEEEEDQDMNSTPDEEEDAFSLLSRSSPTLPPVQFHFPSPLLPFPSLHLLPDSSLLLNAITTTGYLYTLTFPPGELFHAPLGGLEEKWCEETRVDVLAGSVGKWSKVEGVDEGRVVVCSEDGTQNIILELAESGGILRQTALSPSPSSLRSLFSTRLNPPFLSLLSSPLYPQNLFGLSSTSLKLWNLDSGACLHSLELAEGSNGGQGVGLVASEDGETVVVAFRDGRFRSYHVVVGGTTGAVQELVPGIEVDAKGWKEELSTLVDLTVISSPPSSSRNESEDEEDPERILWTLWDTAGIPSLARISLSPTPSMSDTITSDTMSEDQDDWTILPPSPSSSSIFDSLPSTSLGTVSSSDLHHHLYYPLRFPPSSLPPRGSSSSSSVGLTKATLAAAEHSRRAALRPLSLAGVAVHRPAAEQAGPGRRHAKAPLMLLANGLGVGLTLELDEEGEELPRGVEPLDVVAGRGRGRFKDPERSLEYHLAKLFSPPPPCSSLDASGKATTTTTTTTTTTLSLPAAALLIPSLSALVTSRLARADLILSHLATLEEETEEDSGVVVLEAALPTLVGRAQVAKGNALPTASPSHLLASGSSSLALLLPPSALTSTQAYFQHCVTLFTGPLGNAESVVEFARKSGDLESLFGGLLDLGRWEEARGVLFEMEEDKEVQTAALSQLVTALLAAGQAECLTRWSFSTLQASLERLLTFRARNADPLAEPNYSKILYGYLVKRGDYRSAAGIMVQYGRRLTNRHGPWRDLATAQCQAYLAATNALALVEPKHAWVSIAADDASRAQKKRKLVFHIPEEELDNPTNVPEVLSLKDVRKEYTTALARLELAAEFPELERTSFALDGEAVVALFVNIGAVDSAFRAATVLEVDLSSLFEVLTDKCVSLSLPGSQDDASWVSQNDAASTWGGSPSSRAWKLLQSHLERHDSHPYPYARVVLSRALAVGRDAPLPTWLVDFFKKNDVDALGRELVKHDKVKEALELIERLVATTKVSPKEASTTLPYSLIDQLLALDDAAASARQSELRKLVQDRVAGVQKAGAVLAKRARV